MQSDCITKKYSHKPKFESNKPKFKIFLSIFYVKINSLKSYINVLNVLVLRQNYVIMTSYLLKNDQKMIKNLKNLWNFDYDMYFDG